MKKLLSLLIALLMIGALAIGASATEEVPADTVTEEVPADTVAEEVPADTVTEEVTTIEGVTEEVTEEDVPIDEEVTEEDEPIDEEVTEEDAFEDTAPVTDPAEDVPEQEEPDKSFGEMFGDFADWEAASEWLVDNLSTVIGAVLALVTAIVGMYAKGRMMPDIKSKFASLLAAIGSWYDQSSKDSVELHGAFEALKVALMNYIKDEIKPMVDQIAAQSAEVERLEGENAQLRAEYIESRRNTELIETALLEYTRLAAEEFYNIIQQSDLTKAELNRHYETYQEKLKLIEQVVAAKEGELKGGEQL